MAITKIITPDLIDLPFNNTDGIVLAKGTTSVVASIQYLVVAGGGGGGGGIPNSWGGGGGGAGGLLTTTAEFAISTALPLAIGGGGVGASSRTVAGTNGNDSTFATITTTGGGGGGGESVNASNGGSGGGSGGNRTGTVRTPGTGISGQGKNGGVDSSALNGSGSGGGGVTSDGVAAPSNILGGNGGDGVSSSITGGALSYAGGGGGASDYTGSGTGGSGGSGVGGNGGTDGVNSGNGYSGTLNTGGGGGGGNANPSGGATGGTGGSGVIILRMASYITATFTSGVTFNLNNTDVAGQNIYTITATTSGQTVTFSVTGDGTGRPSTAVDGEFRYNTTTKKVEFYDGADWFALTSSAAIQPGTTGACNYPVTASALYQLNDTPNDTCGTYTGVWSGTATYATGKFGKAADFNSSRYITTNVSFDGSTATGSSISFWFNTTNTSLQALIGSATQNGSSYYSTIYLGNATSTFPDESISFWNYDSGGTSVFLAKGGSTTYQDGEWHNCVMVSTSSSKAIYIDGISQTVYYTSSGSVSANANLTNITLAKGDSSSTFTGLIDQVRIFPSALTATQASALYTETAP